MSNTFKFSSRSEKNLQGVNPDLVKVTRRALEISEADLVSPKGCAAVTARSNWWPRVRARP
ncbi:endolysin [Escherichia coli DEC12D]|nr:endolysin [Escherichia coli DEC12D]